MTDTWRTPRARPLVALDLARGIARWPVESQQGSRRNALLASTRLTEAMRERREVEEFLEALHGSAATHSDQDAASGAWSRERSAI